MTMISIEPFSDEYAGAFPALNRAWIEELFALEPADRAVLEHPRTAILDCGGQIFFAVDGSQPIGTVAALRSTATTFELAKMAVAPPYRGRGIAAQLGGAAIAFARGAGGSMMFLETNSLLENAIRLYERLGFVHKAPPHPSPYARSNVYMERAL
jgi:GNAT superfamily N-acetyltransferase